MNVNRKVKTQTRLTRRVHLLFLDSIRRDFGNLGHPLSLNFIHSFILDLSQRTLDFYVYPLGS